MLINKKIKYLMFKIIIKILKNIIIYNNQIDNHIQLLIIYYVLWNILE